MPARVRTVSAFALLCSTAMASLAASGGADVDLITGAEVSPRVTQAESAIWGHQDTVVAAYVDSSGGNLNPPSYCGVSVSTDGGTTFTRLTKANGRRRVVWEFSSGLASYRDEYRMPR